MSDSFELKLNSPLTKADWNKICDVELEHTKKITYKTPSGKEVVFLQKKQNIVMVWKELADGICG